MYIIRVIALLGSLCLCLSFRLFVSSVYPLIHTSIQLSVCLPSISSYLFLPFTNRTLNTHYPLVSERLSSPSLFSPPLLASPRLFSPPSSARLSTAPPLDGTRRGWPVPAGVPRRPLAPPNLLRQSALVVAVLRAAHNGRDEAL